VNRTIDLISQLVRAANEAQNLNALERRHLLARAITAIRELTKKIEAPSVQNAAKEIVDLQIRLAALGAQANTPEEVRDVLLLAARMIRELRISLDDRTARCTEQPPNPPES
jgi:hypothetical protein